LNAKRFILDPGNYGNLSLGLGIGQSLVFTAGAYNVNSINMTSALSGVLEVGTGGPVRIHVGGKLPLPSSGNPILLGQNTVNNKTQVPSNLSFAYDGTLPLQVNGATNLNVNNNAYGVIYAPNAAVAIPAGDWYGAMVMRTLSLQGAASFHYDAALRENFCLTLSWRVVSMSRNKY